MADKLVYITFECICYYLISKGYKVTIYLEQFSDLETEGMSTSSLLYLLKNNYDVNCFKQSFVSGIDYSDSHYRKIIPGDIDLESNYLGELEENISDFFDKFRTEDGKGRFENIGDSIDDIVSVISELVGNSCEHAKADVLIDIDVSGEYSVNEEDSAAVKKGIDPNYWYCGINIVILNFSDKNVYDDIVKKMLYIEKSEKELSRYRRLLDAFKFHSTKFSEEYMQEDFYCMSAFQYKISGRIEERQTGGTGLAQLIKYIEQKHTGFCYVMSGRSILSFIKETLDMDDDLWVGFNKNKDFFTSIPDPAVCLQSQVYFPGTAYNLSFIIRGDVKNE